MDYRSVISQSWLYTQSNKKLVFWFGFLPAFFTTTIGAGYIAYQFFAFKTSFLFSEQEENFFFDILMTIWEILKNNISLSIPLVIFGIIFALGYFLFPTLAQASAIQMIARNRSGQKAGPGTGLKYGLLSFLPLFQYHLLIKTFSFGSILIQMSFVIRNLGVSMFQIFFPIFLFVMIIGLILTLLFTYADFFIVIDDKGVFESMRSSIRMVIMNWKSTFLITLLMILIGVRIIIQVVLIFMIPFLIILIAGYLATVTLPITGIVVGAIVGGIALILASFLNGVVDIFSFTVWTYTFLHITQEKELSAREHSEEESRLEKDVVESKSHDEEEPISAEDLFKTKHNPFE
jgi:hypothetical protein